MPPPMMGNQDMGGGGMDSNQQQMMMNQQTMMMPSAPGSGQTMQLPSQAMENMFAMGGSGGFTDDSGATMFIPQNMAVQVPRCASCA